ncbi:MAG: ATP-dependent endonuclease, partial [Cycloclasticus sp.]
MKLLKASLRNFRRLEDVDIDFDSEETIFVGPNNSGKTSATTAFRLFLKSYDFKIHDFSVTRITDINSFGAAGENGGLITLPAMEMDLWFSIDPDMEFGSVFSLIPNVSALIDHVGIRIKYCVKDEQRLQTDYWAVFPIQDNGERAKNLAHFLSLSKNLSRYFTLEYFTLEEIGGGIVLHRMDPDEAKKSLKSLIRVDFVDAQRNIDDNESAGSTRLSGVFSEYYKKNLQQAEVSKEANRVIDENNTNLNAHYAEHFEGLMNVIHNLGVPSVNDRQLRVVSSLSPEAALQTNTSLLYVDPDSNHELPEAYNGLGFKNLVYMAIQVSHFHLQWVNTEEKRPSCQIIFIEEPEAHLHSQVQQTFISNIWEIVRRAAADVGEPDKIPQLGISTHSSHILDAVAFSKVRYFRRCVLNGEDPAVVTTLNATKVLSLKKFKPNKESAGGVTEDEEVTINFLRKYMKLTHCDLFFSDAAILVEGTVEKLLLPEMINKSAPELNRVYLTTLEVGGAYANRFASLLEFLGMPYLVITDLDSVDP